MCENNIRKQYEWPIYYDIEDSKLLALGKSQISQIAWNFCRTLEKNRYFCGIYSSTNPLNNLFEENVRKDFAVWVAHYDVDKPGYTGDWEFGNILVKEELRVYLEMLIWMKLLLIMNLLLKKDILMDIKTYLIFI